MEAARATAVHRALADPRRARLVAELESAPDGLDATELGRRLDLHANTVRWHLGLLADAGLVTSRPLPRTTPGRPRVVYSLARGAREGTGDEYRLLATVLTGLVARSPGGSAAAEDAGRAWGADLVHGSRAPDESDAVGEVVELLDRQGFAPEAEGREIAMRRCPFLDVAEPHPEIVCAVHRGLVAGALEELGSELEVAELDVLPRPDVCFLRLAPRG